VGGCVVVDQKPLNSPSSSEMVLQGATRTLRPKSAVDWLCGGGKNGIPSWALLILNLASWTVIVGIAGSEHRTSARGPLISEVRISAADLLEPLAILSLRGGGRAREAPNWRRRAFSGKIKGGKNDGSDPTRQAEEAFKAGRYDEAAKLYTGAIAELGSGSGAPAVETKRTALIGNRAACHLKLGRSEPTIADCNTVLRCAIRIPRKGWSFFDVLVGH
jgi:hypothetical protein